MHRDRYPRTLEEAFGPLPHRQLHSPQPRRPHWLDVVGWAVAAVVVVALFNAPAIWRALEELL